MLIRETKRGTNYQKHSQTPNREVVLGVCIAKMTMGESVFLPPLYFELYFQTGMLFRLTDNHLDEEFTFPLFTPLRI